MYGFAICPLPVMYPRQSRPYLGWGYSESRSSPMMGITKKRKGKEKE